jgi:Disulphide bond corrector protein DsbC
MLQFHRLRPRVRRTLGVLCAAITGAHAGCTPVAHPETKPLGSVVSTELAASHVTSEPRSPARETLLGGANSSRLSSPGTDASVHFTLDSAGATLASGGKLLLVARFVIPLGAHIYWRNPGATGLPTVVQFSAPRGFRVGPVAYPGPSRFVGERGAINYGYAGAVALLAEVTVPTPLPEVAEFLAEASWLACSDVCVVEHATARLTLPLAASHTAAPPSATGDTRASQEDPRREALLATLPLPLPPETRAPLRLAPGEILLHAPPGAAMLEFFPHAQLAADERDCVNYPSSDGTLRVSVSTAWPTPLYGTVRATVDGANRYFDVVVP